MATWEDMTDAERDALNEEAYDACVDMLRRADAAYPGCDLQELRRYCADLIRADMAEHARVIKRAERTRATKLDKRAADWARAARSRLAHQEGFIFDADF